MTEVSCIQHWVLREKWPANVHGDQHQRCGKGVVLTGEGRHVHHQGAVLPVVHVAPVLGGDDGVVVETVPGEEGFCLGVSKSEKSIVGSDNSRVLALLYQEGPDAIVTTVPLHR